MYLSYFIQCFHVLELSKVRELISTGIILDVTTKAGGKKFRVDTASYYFRMIECKHQPFLAKWEADLDAKSSAPLSWFKSIQATVLVKQNIPIYNLSWDNAKKGPEDAYRCQKQKYRVWADCCNSLSSE